MDPKHQELFSGELQSSALTSLNIGNNNFARLPLAVEILADVLACNTSMKILDLRQNGFAIDHAVLFGQAMLKNSTLGHLKLGDDLV